ncbi:MAG: glycosyltransferase [Candidatus Nomurabacteria bacterium]|jgi:glycosyltransferase involved in cell wall biosynthesis|nr:glycosyltransferase [Candidatus Nomurabacteria bacterium]
MPKISVIITSYNTEKYITDALDSVLCQTFTDYEILIIDDCSTDSSVKTIKKIIKQHPERTIRLLENKENRGVSFSRNRAMDEATGEYILFMDSDDKYASNDAFEAINNRLMRKNPDVLLFGFTIEYVDKKGRSYRKISMQAGRIAATKTYQLSLASFRYIWSMCFRRELAIDNNVRFDETMDFYEDVVFRSWIMCYADTISVLRKKCYRYFRRVHSGTSLSTGRSFSDGMDSAKELYNSMDDLLDSGQIPKKYRKQIRVAMLLTTGLGILNITAMTVGKKIVKKP